MFVYSGAIHIHSSYSDGSLKPDEIANIANEVGLDYIILTDHNTLNALQFGYEKFYGKTLLIVGSEINDLENKNHYLVLGVDRLVGSFRDIGNNEFGNELSAAEYVKEFHKLGGVGFIAHPFEKRTQFPQHPQFPWTCWESEYFDGIEIWNHMSEWMEGLTESNKFNRLIHPLKSVVAPDIEAVKKWDELNLHRKVSAIGSVDAHSHKQNVLGFFTLDIFPYKVLFKSIRTNVLLSEEINPEDQDSYKEAKQRIINALKEGRSFIVNNYYGDAKGFRFFAEYKGEYYNIGEDFQIEDPQRDIVILKCFVPKQAKIRLIKNGNCILETDTTSAIWNYEGPGNYRVECWLGNKAWIFSNNIRITNKQ